MIQHIFLLAVNIADSITGPAANWSVGAGAMKNRSRETQGNPLVTIDKRYVEPLLTMLDFYGTQLL